MSPCKIPAIQLNQHTRSVILLAMIYLAGTLGVFTSYYTFYHRTFFQQSVKASGDSDLLCLVFTDQEYEAIDWIEDKTEFEWKGKLYDVSRITRTAEGFRVICKNDGLEEMLLDVIKMTQSGKEGQGMKKGNPQPQFCQTFKVEQVKIYHHKEGKGPHVIPSFYLAIYPATFTPPPEA